MPVLPWVHPHPAQTQKHGMKAVLLHPDLRREGLMAYPAVHHCNCSPLCSAGDSEQSCIGAAWHGALLRRLGFPNLDNGRVLRSPSCLWLPAGRCGLETWPTGWTRTFSTASLHPQAL